MPAPVVFGKITKRCVDATLGRDGVRSSGEEFCYTRRFEPFFDQALARS
jgi:hypothetical protein